jgi:hypothetical protein
MNVKNYVYKIDAHDRIIYVNQDWVNFAEANQASDLSRTVLGSFLWNHLHGPEITHIYEMLLHRLRHENRSVTFPFRCDSPGIRRFLQMMMRPQRDDEVEFVCTLLREQPRDEVELLNPATRRDDTFIVMCSWCKKVQASGWVEVEEAVIRLHLFDQPLLPSITHGICLSCKRHFYDN